MIGERLHQRIVRYRQKHPGASYRDALRAVEKSEPGEVRNYLAEAWASPTGTGAPAAADSDDKDEAGALEPAFIEGAKRVAGQLIDERVKALRLVNPSLTYADAFGLVLFNDPGLARQYETGAHRHAGRGA